MKDFPDFSGNLNQLLQINNQITNSGTALQLGVEPVWKYKLGSGIENWVSNKFQVQAWVHVNSTRKQSHHKRSDSY